VLFLFSCLRYQILFSVLTWKIQELESEPFKKSASKSELLHVPRTGISKGGATADNPDNAIVPDGIANRLYWDSSQFDVLGGVAMISDEQDRTDGSPDEGGRANANWREREKEQVTSGICGRRSHADSVLFPSFYPIILQMTIQRPNSRIFSFSRFVYCSLLLNIFCSHTYNFWDDFL